MGFKIQSIVSQTAPHGKGHHSWRISTGPATCMPSPEERGSSDGRQSSKELKSDLQGQEGVRARDGGGQGRKCAGMNENSPLRRARLGGRAGRGGWGEAHDN